MNTFVNSLLADIASQMVAGTLVLAALLVLCAYVSMRKPKRPDWTAPLYMEEGFSFTGSWASTLTGAGALLSVLVAAEVLPETTRVPVASYMLLNFLAAFLVVAAGLIYTAASKNTARSIPVWTFLLSAFCTSWGVCGQLVTLGFLLFDLGGGTGLRFVLVVLGLLLISVFVGACIYVWTSIHLILAQTNPVPPADANLPAGAPVRSPTAALL